MFSWLLGHDTTPHFSGSSWGGSIATGFAPEAYIATEAGWRQAETLAMGAHVLTLDGPPMPITQLLRGPLWAPGQACPPALYPLEVPAHALGNTRSMILLAEQLVLLDEPMAGLFSDSERVLVKAAFLRGFRGIEPVQHLPHVEVTCLGFATPQIVPVMGGAHVLCPVLADEGVQPLSEMLAQEPPESGSGPVLRPDQVQQLLAALTQEDAALGRVLPQHNAYAALRWGVADP